MKQSYIAVKDFERFQHYKGRTPPWIKLYNALLDDYRFLQLSDAARGQLVLMWLVASRHANRIPNDATYIAEAIHCKSKLQLDVLIAAGWLSVVTDVALAECKQDASKPLASCPTSAIPEVEGEKEREIEQASPPTVADDSVPDTARPALRQLLATARNPKGAAYEIKAYADGLRPPTPTADQLGRAVLDFTANGSEWSAAHFRAYVKRAIAEDSKTPRNSTPRLSKQEIGRQNLEAAVARRAVNNG